MKLSKVAAKRLTASDLTFFASHYHTPGQRSKQKAINLNADVFVSLFYPGLRDRFTEIHFALVIVGPGGATPYALSRKALRSRGAKNWRLNGELINDPTDEPGRFDRLAEGDVALLSFEGAEEPQCVVMVLVSAAEDADLHAAIAASVDFQGRYSMRPLGFHEIRDLFESTRAAYAQIHPLEALLGTDTVEDVLYGSSDTQEVIVTGDGRGMPVSQESVRRQATTAGETGQFGEEAFEQWLLQIGLHETEFEWVSSTHARAAYDFTVTAPRWDVAESPLYIDVKTTRGPHGTAFHMTMAEIRWAAEHANYRIARISSLTETSAEVRILSNVTSVCAKLAECLASLPAGVRVDSVELDPALFTELDVGQVERNLEAD